MSDGDHPRYQPGRESFGRWLLAQHVRGDWVGDLAMAARGDRTFPKDGDPEEVRKHLSAQQAYVNVLQAVDDAENEWNRR
ncbi:YozE family protein [Sphingomonas sp. RT2P30]|uniref:YozE family protein n=1 Tax=Parasphingomonas halimpatiens TaxID=3096162 RepID=UPI002FC72825